MGSWAKLPERPEENSSNIYFDVLALIEAGWDRELAPPFHKNPNSRFSFGAKISCSAFSQDVLTLSFLSLPASHLCHQGLDWPCLLARSNIYYLSIMTNCDGSLTFIRVLYNPEGDGEEAGSHVTLMKVPGIIHNFNRKHFPAGTHNHNYFSGVTNVAIYPVRFTALYWLVSNLIFALGPYAFATI